MKYLVMILVAALIVGCATPSEPQEKNAPEIPENAVIGDENEMPADIVEEPIEEEPPVETVPEVEVCDMEQDPTDLNYITLSFADEGVDRSDDGFTFEFYPRDKDGNILPVEGNLQVYLYWTEVFNGERRSKKSVFGFNKFIKLSDVGTDCAPEPVFISFDEIEQNLAYDVEEDDPGFIKVIFKRSGSYDEFADTYQAPEGTSFFP